MSQYVRLSGFQRFMEIQVVKLASYAPISICFFFVVVVVILAYTILTFEIIIS